MPVKLNRMTGRRDMSPDPARMRRAISPPERTSICYGLVGHVDDLTGLPEPSPSYVRIEQGQIYVEVTMEPDGDQIIARLGMAEAGIQEGAYFALAFGCRVVLELVKGNPQNAVIVARLNDALCSFPVAVAGVQTGAVGAVAPFVGVPAPTWSFTKLGAGKLLAIETGIGGDILIHSNASIELKALPGGGAIHLNGRCALGEGPTTPPVGGTVGPAGVDIPGVPAVPAIPLPALPSIPAPPLTIVPYIGLNDGIIRSKDAVQSHVGVDPQFWAYMIGLFAHPIIGPVLLAAGIVLPISVHSEHGGRNGPGSQHTAST